MKIRYALAGLALLATGSFSFQQGEEPAEKVYKNIITFKGVPARDIMPAMKFMNAALKVDCGYCHDTADYAADKPNKEITRKMVEMQREANRNFFNDRLEVTCMTCHNGKTHPEGMPAPDGVALRHRRFSSELRPADYFKKHLEAVGGAGPVLRLTGTLKEGAGPETPFEVVQGPDGRFLATLDELQMGFDGVTAWTSVGGTTTKLWGDDANSLARMGRTYRAQAAFDAYQRPAIAGQETIGNQRAIVIRGNLPTQFTTDELYFDETSGLLVRLVATTRTTIGAVPTYVDYADYRKVGGIMVAHRILSQNWEGKPTVAQFTSAKAEPSFDSKKFSPPAAKK